MLILIETFFNYLLKNWLFLNNVTMLPPMATDHLIILWRKYSGCCWADWHSGRLFRTEQGWHGHHWSSLNEIYVDTQTHPWLVRRAITSLWWSIQKHSIFELLQSVLVLSNLLTGTGLHIKAIQDQIEMFLVLAATESCFSQLRPSVLVSGLCYVWIINWQNCPWKCK